MDKQFSVTYRAVRVFQVERPGADGLDLRAGQRDTRFVTLLYKVVMMGFPILGNRLDTFLFRNSLLLSGKVYHKSGAIAIRI